MNTKHKKTMLVRAIYIMAIVAVVFSFATVTYAAPPAKSLVTIWHAYGEGGSEETALLKLVSEYEKSHPFVDVVPVFVPFDAIFSDYENAVMSGGGPDMFTAPNDTLGNEARAGLIQPLDGLLKPTDLHKYSQVAVDGVTIEGHIYAVPGLVKAVALYYNKETVPVPPATTDELLQMVKDGKKVAINPDVYHNFGFWAAFGGTLLDNNGRCIADQGGFVEAFQYLKDLQNAGAIFDWNQEWTIGTEGGVDMTITGPWILGDLRNFVGDKLGVALMPAGPVGPSRPITGIDGWYLNPNSPNKKAALDLALYIFGKNGLKDYADIAGDPIARTDINITDPLVSTFVEAANQGIARPQSPEFSNYWEPFSLALNAVLYENLPPSDAVSSACAWMNEANGK